MKKQLNVDLIQSELRGGSAFFPGYQGRPSPTQPEEPPPLHDSPKTAPEPNTTIRKHVPKPDAEQPQTPSVQTPATQGVPPPGPRPGPRTEPGPDHLVPKVKRQMRQRQPFDIYEDQYERLKQISDAERGFVNGRGMSQMVREAIDAYLAAEPASDKN